MWSHLTLPFLIMKFEKSFRIFLGKKILLKKLIRNVFSSQDFGFFPPSCRVFNRRFLLILGAWAGWVLAPDPPPAAACHPLLALQRRAENPLPGASLAHHLRRLPLLPSGGGVFHAEEDGEHSGLSIPPDRVPPPGGAAAGAGCSRLPGLVEPQCPPESTPRGAAGGNAARHNVATLLLGYSLPSCLTGVKKTDLAWGDIKPQRLELLSARKIKGSSTTDLSGLFVDCHWKKPWDFHGYLA